MSVSKSTSPVLPVSFSSSSCKSPSKVGARLRRFASKWKRVTTDPWILETVAESVVIDFVFTPYQKSVPRNVTMTDGVLLVCDEEVANL